MRRYDRLKEKLVADLSEVIPLDAEREIQAEIVDIVLQHLAQVLIILRVDRLDVVIGDGDAQDVLIERAREVSIEQLSVSDRLPDHAADKLEVRQMILDDDEKKVAAGEAKIWGEKKFRASERQIRLRTLLMYDKGFGWNVGLSWEGMKRA